MRARWAAIGAALAVTLGAAGTMTILAAPNTSPAALSPITPCRLLDTRPGDANVGPRATALNPDETFLATAWGTNGECTIPATATGLSMNVTVLNGSAPSFLTVFPADVDRPKASSLNWQPGQSATPNAVTSPLSADGKLALYNFAGTVDVIVDVVGYYGVLPVAPTVPPSPTTLPAFTFEAAMTPPTFNANYSLAGFDQVNNTDIRGSGWLAPRDCTLSGTVTLVGAVQNSNPNLGAALLFTRWNAASLALIANSGPLPLRPATAAGTQLTIPSLSVNAGELVTLSQLTNVGTTFAANTTLYLSARCA